MRMAAPTSAKIEVDPTTRSEVALLLAPVADALAAPEEAEEADDPERALVALAEEPEPVVLDEVTCRQASSQKTIAGAIKMSFLLQQRQQTGHWTCTSRSWKTRGLGESREESRPGPKLRVGSIRRLQIDLGISSPSRKVPP